MNPIMYVVGGNRFPLTVGHGPVVLASGPVFPFIVGRDDKRHIVTRHMIRGMNLLLSLITGGHYA